MKVLKQLGFWDGLRFFFFRFYANRNFEKSVFYPLFPAPTQKDAPRPTPSGQISQISKLRNQIWEISL